MSQTPNLDAARASLQQAIDQANAIVKPIIDAMREAGMLTPAPEPAAAPAVDDDLLRDLHRAAGVGSAWSTKPEEWAARLLASEPMQRLRAAWTEQLWTEMNERIVTAVRERDEARAELLRTERALRAQAKVATNWKRELTEAQATVERLRAAQQQFPDVGPVTRTDPDEDGWTWLRVGDHRGFFNPHISADDHRLSAARELALAAFLDAEADNTSSDDEEREQREAIVYDVMEDDANEGLDALTVAQRIVAALDVHRARGGQEAGRG